MNAAGLAAALVACTAAAWQTLAELWSQPPPHLPAAAAAKEPEEGKKAKSGCACVIC